MDRDTSAVGHEPGARPAALESPPADHVRGPIDVAPGALEPEPAATISEKSSGPSACSALTKRNTVCGRDVGVRLVDGLGPRCASHRQRAERPPVRSIRSLDDALRLASWAGIAVAEGRLEAARGNSIILACKEWRIAFADGGEMEKVRDLLARMEADAAEFADLRRRIKLAEDAGLIARVTYASAAAR